MGKGAYLGNLGIVLEKVVINIVDKDSVMTHLSTMHELFPRGYSTHTSAVRIMVLLLTKLDNRYQYLFCTFQLSQELIASACIHHTIETKFKSDIRII